MNEYRDTDMARKRPAYGIFGKSGTAVFRSLTLVLPMFLSGCQTMQSNNISAGEAELREGIRATKIISHTTDNARIARLWSATEKSMLENRYKEADIFIQEALNLAPNDGVLLSRAAEIKLSLNEPALAETLAARSLAYTEEDRSLNHRNWMIIEHARDMRGDLLGRREAHRMVQQYR